MNCTLDPSLDSVRYTQQACKGTEQLQEWLTFMQLSNIWRVQHLYTKMYTSPSRKHRINFLFVSNKWASTATAHIRPSLAGSDHTCPTVVIQTSNIRMGKVHWQLPTWFAPSASTQIQKRLVQFGDLLQDRQLSQLDNKITRITIVCRHLHQATIHERKKQTTQAFLLWRKCHIVAVQNLTSDNIANAIQTRQIWKELSKQKEERNKANAFDRRFEKFEQPLRSFSDKRAHVRNAQSYTRWKGRTEHPQATQHSSQKHT